MVKKLKPFTIIFKPKIVQIVRAVDWEDAVKFFKNQIKEYPIEFDDVESFEIEDGSPQPEALQKLYSALAKAIENAETSCRDFVMVDIRNIGFREEDEDEFIADGCDYERIPTYVYCDLHEYDCGEQTIYKDVEYDTCIVMKNVKRLNLLKTGEEE